jgi:PAS domain-containing protein
LSPLKRSWSPSKLDYTVTKTGSDMQVSDALDKLHEANPEERMRLLKALVEPTSDAIIGLDADHIVVSWNTGARIMLP